MPREITRGHRSSPDSRRRRVRTSTIEPSRRMFEGREFFDRIAALPVSKSLIAKLKLAGLILPERASPWGDNKSASLLERHPVKR